MDKFNEEVTTKINSRVSDAIVEYFRVQKDDKKDNFLKNGRNSPPAALKNYIDKQVEKKFSSQKAEDE